MLRYLIAPFVVVGVVLLGVRAIWHFGLMDEVTATVTGKERVCESLGGECKYLVYTDLETFKNVDAFFALKYNSSDVYGRLQENKRYRFTVTGLRFKYFSWYRNVLDYEDAS